METSQQSSFEALLNESRDLVCERLRAAVAAMLEKSDQALVEWVGKTQNRDLQKLYQEARGPLGEKRKAIETEFHKHYLRAFRKHSSDDAGPGFSELETSLTLVGEEDLEETLRFKEMATKLRRYCDEELAALDQRIGVLVGDANLAAEDNPFGPESILDAYQHACHALDDAGPKVRGVMLRLFDDHVADSVRSIYKDVNQLLVRNSILPKIRYGVSKKPGDKAEGARKDAPKEAEKKDKDAAEAQKPAAAGAEQDLFALLSKLVGGGTGAGGGVALPPGAVVLQGAELLGALSQLQRGEVQGLPGGVPATLTEQAQAGTTNVLRELKTTTFGAGLVQMDATTLDILSMLFDQLFDDPKVPAGLKGLIGRLQIPMLKVAIADKSFFAKKTHPARKLLDEFGEVAVRLPAEFTVDSPTFMHLEAIIQHIVDNFQEDHGIFDSAREQLQGIVAEHDQQVEVETRVVAEKVEQGENLAIAKTAAEDEVKVRLQAHKVPGAVLEFLVEHWLRYLLIAHAKSGRGGADWKEAIEAMDQLIWSVEPKNTPEERRKLAAGVPGLVKRIIAGLQALGTADEVRERFFGELMKIHAEAIGHKDKDKKAPAPAVGEKTAPQPTLDFTAPVTVKNPYGAGEVKVSGLDFAAPPAPNDIKGRKAAMVSLLSVDPPANIAMGDWVEFRPKEADAQRRATKVLFITPKKTKYLFSDRQGKDVIELTRPEIVRRLRSGEAVRLDGAPEEALFERIMNGMLGKLKAPAPAA